MRAFLEKLRKDARGNVLLLAGAGTVSLIGGAGLGVDTVQWYLWKRQLQQAVDSAALAGAQTRSQGGNYVASARRELGRTANTAVAEETIGNAAAYFQGVEVIATTSRALPFTSVFLDVAPTIRARSVAATVTGGKHCVISLARNGIGVNGTGSARVNLGCGVSSNSSSSGAIDLTGTSYLRASPLSAVGGINYSNTNIEAGTEIITYSVEQQDPLASRGLAVPTSPSACSDNNFTVNPNTSQSITPGRYCNGITVRGELHLAPGVYIVDRGEFKVNSQGSIHGEGVTIILTGNSPSNVATTDIAGGAQVDLRAPTEAENPDWHNILIYQDPMAEFPLNKLAGDSNFNMEGIVYLPRGDVRFAGSSGQHAECLLLVANRVNFVGESSFGNNCPADYDDINLDVRRVRVVE
jgi:Flp pilus assembly protein TadG